MVCCCNTIANVFRMVIVGGCVFAVSLAEGILPTIAVAERKKRRKEILLLLLPFSLNSFFCVHSLIAFVIAFHS